MSDTTVEMSTQRMCAEYSDYRARILTNGGNYRVIAEASVKDFESWFTEEQAKATKAGFAAALDALLALAERSGWTVKLDLLVAHEDLLEDYKTL